MPFGVINGDDDDDDVDDDSKRVTWSDLFDFSVALFVVDAVFCVWSYNHYHHRRVYCQSAAAS